jgi:hypothetical protein
MKASAPEFRIQADWVLQTQLRYPDLLFTIAPAGFIMSAGQAMKMVRLGYRSGTPDVLVFEPRGIYHGLLIEFKAPGGTISPAQREFVRLADVRGYKTAFCFSTAQGNMVLEKYLTHGSPVDL